jgi:hexulose-6-phosphate isomerase
MMKPCQNTVQKVHSLFSSANIIGSKANDVDVAAQLGSGAILLVPGRLGSGAKFNIGYQDTWDRVSAELKKVVPYAAQKKVCITPENVWNKFLVSPLDMRAFVDQFRSPYVKVHFDVGNILQYGYPQDWIRTLGKRIVRVHVKDFLMDRKEGKFYWKNLGEGEIDWPEVRKALEENLQVCPKCSFHFKIDAWNRGCRSIEIIS